MKKIFVGNLSWKTSEEELKEHFETFGEVISAKIVIDNASNRSKGYGFVEMKDADAAEAAIRELNGKTLSDRALRISIAEERQPRERGNFGGGNRSMGYGQGRRSS